MAESLNMATNPVVSSGLTLDGIRLDERKANANAQEDTDHGHTGRFSLFYLGYIPIEHSNFSMIPAYYNRKLGTEQRVFTAIYKESKLKLFLYCLQVLFLLSWVFRSAYNGFGPPKYFEKFPSSLTYINNTESYLTRSNVYWSAFWNTLTYDFWGPVHDYRRRLNILTFSFVFNALVQRMFCLLRHQRPEILKPLIVKRLMKKSDHDTCEILSFLDCLFSFKLTLKEYILYCFTNRPLPEDLTRKNPIMKAMTHQDVLKFDLLSIHNGAVPCTTKIFKNITRSTIFGLFVMVFETFFITETSIHVANIYGQSSHISGSILLDCIRRIDLFLMVFMIVCTVTDSFVLVVPSIIISNRLYIYNSQLIHFITQIRSATNSPVNRYNRCERIQFMQHNDRVSNKNFLTVPIKDSVCTLDNNNLIISHHKKCFTFLNSAQIILQRSLEARCEQLIMILHQLLYEFRLLRAVFTNRTDIDVLISLCSYTWILSVWIVVFNCKTCVTKGPMIMATFTGNFYLWNVLNQVYFLARISQKVSVYLDNFSPTSN